MSGPRYIDMPTQEHPVAPDDWIWTDRGARYIVTAARVLGGRSRHDGCPGECPEDVVRYAVRCDRLARHTPVPGDVRAIRFHSHRYRQPVGGVPENPTKETER